MKASLLLTGLTAGMMAVGAAHAADTAGHAHMPTLHGQILAAASTSGDGLLSTLRNLLSSDRDARARGADRADSRTTCNGEARRGNADPAIGGMASPGPAGQAAAGTARVDGDIPHPTNDLGDEGADTRRTVPALGWQSLLPGSIQ